jgi:LytS/YehU family sensor histidine kinase
MEYVIYDCRSEKVPLEKEINFIESYIQLERLRYEDDVDITFEKVRANNQLLIAPMLLVPFVENSFKHGSDTTKGGFWLFIKTYVENNRLFVEIRNSSKFKEKAAGIGIENVRKRLDFLYAGKYQLDINNKDEVFEVNLSIQL